MVQCERCFYCGVWMTYDYLRDRSRTRDHVFPKRLREQHRGLISHRTVSACNRCNHLKGTNTVVEFVKTHITPPRWPCIDWDYLYGLFGASRDTVGDDRELWTVSEEPANT